MPEPSASQTIARHALSIPMVFDQYCNGLIKCGIGFPTALSCDETYLPPCCRQKANSLALSNPGSGFTLQLKPKRSETMPFSSLK